MTAVEPTAKKRPMPPDSEPLYNENMKNRNKGRYAPSAPPVKDTPVDREVACYTLPGTRYGRLNQDYCTIDELRGVDPQGMPQCTCIVVLDGEAGGRCAPGERLIPQAPTWRSASFVVPPVHLTIFPPFSLH
jgi:hypothetical protein